MKYIEFQCNSNFYELISIENNNSECERCGICCYQTSVLCDISFEEWEPIVEFIKEKQKGVLTTLYGKCEYQSFKIDSIEDIKKAYEDEADSDLWRAIIDGSCPFLTKITNDKFYCEIHEIRPTPCRKFTCIGNPEWQDKKLNQFLVEGFPQKEGFNTRKKCFLCSSVNWKKLYFCDECYHWVCQDCYSIDRCSECSQLLHNR